MFGWYSCSRRPAGGHNETLGSHARDARWCILLLCRKADCLGPWWFGQSTDGGLCEPSSRGCKRRTTKRSQTAPMSIFEGLQETDPFPHDPCMIVPSTRGSMTLSERPFLECSRTIIPLGYQIRRVPGSSRLSIHTSTLSMPPARPNGPPTSNHSRLLSQKPHDHSFPASFISPKSS